MARTKLNLYLIGAFTCVAAVAPAQAAPIDLSTWTCKQFLASDGDEMKLTLAWLERILS